MGFLGKGKTKEEIEKNEADSENIELSEVQKRDKAEKKGTEETEETEEEVEDYESDVDVDEGDRKEGVEPLGELRQIKFGYKAHLQKLEVLLNDPSSGKVALLFFTIMCIIDVCSLLALGFETLDGPNWGSSDPEFPRLLEADQYVKIDIAFTCVFAAELLLRFFMADLYFFCDDPTDPTIPFFQDLYNYSDFVACLPLLVTEFSDKAGVDISSLDYQSTILIIRMARVFKLLRRFPASDVLYETIRRSIGAILYPLFCFLAVAFILGTLLFYLEPCYSEDTNLCPYNFSFSGTYFAVNVLTTVGFGDQVPNLLISRLVVVIMMILSGIFISCPFIIIGNNFDDVWREKQEYLQRYLAEIPQVQEGKADDWMVYTSKMNSRARNMINEYMLLMQRASKVELAMQHLFSTSKKEMEDFDNLWRCILRCETTVKSFTSKIDYLIDDLSIPVGDFPDSVKWEEEGIGEDEIYGEKSDELDGINPVNQMKNTEKDFEPVKEKTLADDGVDVEPQFERESCFTCLTKEYRWKNLYNFLYKPSNLVSALYCLLIFCAVCGSLITFGLETMAEFREQGEGSYACEAVVKYYCEKYSDVTYNLDPGCYKFNTSTYNNDNFGRTMLNYYCEEEQCFGATAEIDSQPWSKIENFGSEQNFTCSAAYSVYGIEPFRNESMLDDSNSDAIFPNYNLLVSICDRSECQDGDTIRDFTQLYYHFELYCCLVLLGDLVLRIIATGNPLNWFLSFSSYIDILAVGGFVFQYIQQGNTPEYYLYTTTDPLWLTVLKALMILRICRLGPYFGDWAPMGSTIKRSLMKLAVPVFILILVCVIAGILLYVTDNGNECFTGSECYNSYGTLIDMSQYDAQYEPGKRLLVNDDGTLTDFKDFRYSAWFVIVTLTTTGFGDVIPNSNYGSLIAGILMVLATFYLVFPLSIVGREFEIEYRKNKLQRPPIRFSTNMDNCLLDKDNAVQSIKKLSLWIAIEAQKFRGDTRYRNKEAEFEGKKIIPQVEQIKVNSWLLRMAIVVRHLERHLEKDLTYDRMKANKGWLRRIKAEIMRGQETHLPKYKSKFSTKAEQLDDAM